MIKNLTKNKVLANDIKHCRSHFAKCRGLMFTKRLKDKGLIFYFPMEKKVSLHMFFVFYPIDVLWLNKDKEVVQMKKNFLPFSLISTEKPSCYIAELPNGIIETTNTEIGDRISF